VDGKAKARFRDVRENLVAHAVVWIGQVADGLAEEDFIANDASLGHRQHIVCVGLMNDAV
jgi:hypothetical protein